MQQCIQLVDRRAILHLAGVVISKLMSVASIFDASSSSIMPFFFFIESSSKYLWWHDVVEHATMRKRGVGEGRKIGVSSYLEVAETDGRWEISHPHHLG